MPRFRFFFGMAISLEMLLALLGAVFGMIVAFVIAVLYFVMQGGNLK